MKITFLFLVSLFFYYKSGGYFFFLLLFSTVADYLLGLLIFSGHTRFQRKLYVTLSIIINIGVLAYFKYAYFFAQTFNDLTGSGIQVSDWLAIMSNYFTGSHLDVSKIILPVGVSFYTFQTISYTVDIYRGKLEPVRSIIDFGFYVTFFPQLVAGPIVRAAEFIPQLYKKYELSKEKFGEAIFYILNGLIKKILIADFISVNFVDRVFDAPLSYSGFENLMAIYGYSIQIYCDFSGYTDIAIGLALLMGFRLPLNFNSPYKAYSITDFWHRWHISLSTWLKDYLYIPLGGNKVSGLRTYANLIVTMLLGGLWHGANLRFLIWGGLHGLALAFEKGINKWFKWNNSKFKWIGIFITFHFVTFTWLFFRAPDMTAVNQMLNRIFYEFHVELIAVYLASYGLVFSLIATGFIIHWLPTDLKTGYRNSFKVMPLYAKALVAAFVAILLYQVQAAGLQPFIYFQF